MSGNATGQSLGTYDIQVDPASAWGSPVDVYFDWQIFKITDLSIESATISLASWLNLYWYDARLAWDSASYPGVETLNFYSSTDRELTEIWVPDVTILNQDSGGLEQWGEKAAVVDPDGVVFWRRQGTLNLLCTYKGLAAFPFDKLECDAIFGTWSRSLDLLRVNLLDTSAFGIPDPDGLPGIAFGFADSAEASNQFSSYQEYTFKPTATKLEVGNYTYIDGQQYQSITYTLFFNRATAFYITKAVIPNIFLTYLSIAALLLDPRAGERLGFSATMFLSMIAVDITFSERLPVCREWNWLQTLIFVSLVFAAATIAESLYIVWLYFLDKPEEEEEFSNFDDDEPSVTTRRMGSIKSPGSASAAASPDKGNASPRGPSSEVHLERSNILYYDGRKLNRRNVEKGKRIDRIYFHILIVVYTMFTICMFATIPAWQGIP